jgi:hypothetical protein
VQADKLKLILERPIPIPITSFKQHFREGRGEGGRVEKKREVGNRNLSTAPLPQA